MGRFGHTPCELCRHAGQPGLAIKFCVGAIYRPIRKNFTYRGARAPVLFFSVTEEPHTARFFGIRAVEANPSLRSCPGELDSIAGCLRLQHTSRWLPIPRHHRHQCSLICQNTTAAGVIRPPDYLIGYISCHDIMFMAGRLSALRAHAVEETYTISGTSGT